jgi:hypothetical protein
LIGSIVGVCFVIKRNRSDDDDNNGRASPTTTGGYDRATPINNDDDDDTQYANIGRVANPDDVYDAAGLRAGADQYQGLAGVSDGISSDYSRLPASSSGCKSSNDV